MPPSTSFTPQQVINTARLRHPGLSALVLDDTALVDDYNQATRELLTQVVKTKREALMEETADLVVAGADGSRIDFDFPEGELVGIPTAIEAVQAGTRVRVLLKTNVEHREAMAREFIDDGRPAGIIIRDRVNNRWELLEIINWTGVTAISVFGTFFPVAVTVPTLNTEVLLPFILFGPLTEQVALQLGHRSDVSPEWKQLQQANVTTALEAALLEFAL
jgi:hypothetical protein